MSRYNCRRRLNGVDHGRRSRSPRARLASCLARCRRESPGGAFTRLSTGALFGPPTERDFRSSRSRDLELRRSLGVTSRRRAGAPFTRPVVGTNARHVGDDDESTGPPGRARTSPTTSGPIRRPIGARSTNRGREKVCRWRTHRSREARGRHPGVTRFGRSANARRSASEGGRSL